MGNNKTNYEFGREPSRNGHDHFFSPSNWRYHRTTKRPVKEISKTKKTMLSIADYLAGIICLGGVVSRIETLTDAVVIGIGVVYMAIRVCFYGLMKYEAWQIKRIERKKLQREEKLIK